MVRFQIPKVYLPGFQILVSLQESDVEKLTHFLNDIPVGTGPQTFGTLFDDAFEGKEPFTRLLTSTLYSLGSFKLSQAEKLDDKELAEAVAESYNLQTEATLSDRDKAALAKTLERVFKASINLSTTFKALNLLAENESVIRENHIITDIRLLFNDDLKHKERHGLLIHQLKITAEQNGDQDEYYFNLTRSELQKLQEQIIRAMEKEKLIREDYTNISFISITE